jgi:hypothetical protein
MVTLLLFLTIKMILNVYSLEARERIRASNNFDEKCLLSEMVAYYYHVQHIDAAIRFHILRYPAGISGLTEVITHQDHIQNIDAAILVDIPGRSIAQGIKVTGVVDKVDFAIINSGPLQGILGIRWYVTPNLVAVPVQADQGGLRFPRSHINIKVIILNRYRRRGLRPVLLSGNIVMPEKIAPFIQAIHATLLPGKGASAAYIDPSI